MTGPITKEKLLDMQAKIAVRHDFSWFEIRCDAMRELLESFEEKERFRQALTRIACLQEGETVTPSFDEPASAKEARKALRIFPSGNEEG